MRLACCLLLTLYSLGACAQRTRLSKTADQQLEPRLPRQTARGRARFTQTTEKSDDSYNIQPEPSIQPTNLRSSPSRRKPETTNGLPKKFRDSSASKPRLETQALFRQNYEVEELIDEAPLESQKRQSKTRVLTETNYEAQNAPPSNALFQASTTESLQEVAKDIGSKVLPEPAEVTPQNNQVEAKASTPFEEVSGSSESPSEPPAVTVPAEPARVAPTRPGVQRRVNVRSRANAVTPGPPTVQANQAGSGRPQVRSRSSFNRRIEEATTAGRRRLPEEASTAAPAARSFSRAPRRRNEGSPGYSGSSGSSSPNLPPPPPPPSPVSRTASRRPSEVNTADASQVYASLRSRSGRRINANAPNRAAIPERAAVPERTSIPERASTVSASISAPPAQRRASFTRFAPTAAAPVAAPSEQSGSRTRGGTRGRFRDIPPIIDEQKLEVLPLFEAESKTVAPIPPAPIKKTIKFVSRRKVNSAEETVPGSSTPGSRQSLPIPTSTEAVGSRRRQAVTSVSVMESVVSEVSEVTSRSVSRKALPRYNKTKLGVNSGSRGRGSKVARDGKPNSLTSSEEDIEDSDNYPESFKALIQAKKQGKPESKGSSSSSATTRTPIRAADSVTKAPERIVTSSAAPAPAPSPSPKAHSPFEDSENEVVSKATPAPRKRYSPHPSYQPKPRKTALPVFSVATSTTTTTTERTPGESKLHAKYSSALKSEPETKSSGKPSRSFSPKPPRGLYSSRKGKDGLSKSKSTVTATQAPLTKKPTRFSSRYRNEGSRSSIRTSTRAPAYLPTIPTVTTSGYSVKSQAHTRDKDLELEVISFDDPVNTVASANLVRAAEAGMVGEAQTKATEKPGSIIEQIINSITSISTTVPPTDSTTNQVTPGLREAATQSSAILKLATKRPDRTRQVHTDQTTRTIVTTSEKPTTIIQRILSSLSAIQAESSTDPNSNAKVPPPQVGIDFNTISFSGTTPMSRVTKSATALPVQITTNINPLSVLDSLSEDQVLEKRTIGELLALLNRLTTPDPQNLVVVTPKSATQTNTVQTTQTLPSTIPEFTTQTIATTPEATTATTAEPSAKTVTTTTDIANEIEALALSADAQSTSTIPPTTFEPSTLTTQATTEDPDSFFTIPSTLPAFTNFEVSPGSVSIFSANDISTFFTTDFPSSTAVTFRAKAPESTTLTATTTTTTTTTITTTDSSATGNSSSTPATAAADSTTITTTTPTTAAAAASITTTLPTTATTESNELVESSAIPLSINSEPPPTTEPATTTATPTNSTTPNPPTTTPTNSTTTPDSTTPTLTTTPPANPQISNRSGRLLSSDPDPLQNSLDDQPAPTPAPTPDYFIFAVLNNNTILRKRPPKYPNKDTPFLIVGVYPNNTIVRRFPNGTLVPMEPVIRVDQNTISPVEANALSLGSSSSVSTDSTTVATSTSTRGSPSTTARVAQSVTLPSLTEILNGKTVQAFNSIINISDLSTKAATEQTTKQVTTTIVTTPLLSNKILEDPTTTTTRATTTTQRPTTVPPRPTETTTTFRAPPTTTFRGFPSTTYFPTFLTTLFPTLLPRRTTTTQPPETTTVPPTTTTQPPTTTTRPPPVVTTATPITTPLTTTTFTTEASTVTIPTTVRVTVKSRGRFLDLSSGSPTTRTVTVTPSPTVITTTFVPTTTTTRATTTTLPPTTTTTTVATTTTPRPPPTTTVPRSTTARATRSTMRAPPPRSATVLPTVQLFTSPSPLPNEILESSTRRARLLTEQQKKDLQTITDLEREQAALLRQLSLLTSLNFATTKNVATTTTTTESSNDLANRIIALAIERDKTKTTTVGTTPTETTTPPTITITPGRIRVSQGNTPSLDELVKQFNIVTPSTLTSPFGKSNDAIIAQLLREQGIGPTTPDSLSDIYRQTTTTTRKPRPTTRAPGPLMQSLNWLLNRLAPPTTKRPKTKPKPRRLPVPVPAQDAEILTHEPTHITPVVTAPPNSITNSLSQAEIRTLIKQLEAIQRDPSSGKTLDLNSIKGLQNLINVNEGVQVNSAGSTGATSRGTVRPYPTSASTTAKAISIEDFNSNNQLGSSSTPLSLSVSNNILDEVEIISTTYKPRPKVSLPPVKLRPVPGVEETDTLVRGQLVSAAVNVTRAISQFLGSALQDAAHQFSRMFSNASAVRDYISTSSLFPNLANASRAARASP